MGGWVAPWLPPPSNPATHNTDEVLELPHLTSGSLRNVGAIMSHALLFFLSPKRLGQVRFVGHLFFSFFQNLILLMLESWVAHCFAQPPATPSHPPSRPPTQAPHPSSYPPATLGWVGEWVGGWLGVVSGWAKQWTDNPTFQNE